MIQTNIFEETFFFQISTYTIINYRGLQKIEEKKIYI